MTTGFAPEIALSSVDAPAVPLDAIRTLVEERARYEGWLEALDARRAVTPTHVLERVRQDYAGRLARVTDELSSHAAPLRAHEQTLTERHRTVEQRLGDARDALAEIELRTLVGEYTADDGEQRRSGTQQTIATLEHDLGGAAAALADVQGLVARVAPLTPATTAASVVAAPVSADGGVNERAVVPSDAPGTRSAHGDVLAGLGDASGGTPSAEAPSTGSAGRDQTGGVDTGAFDHGAVDAARAALGDRETSLTPAFSDAIRSGGTGHALGGGRPQAPEPAAAGQEKTLRCQDCGAFNYPTEWYCEKCGGELAAL